ncbi:hypothetical protein E8E11_006304 [Didymella keratinophila]|nr:hypothetical protein E8E11_006304 [Didymella keratinophila]
MCLQRDRPILDAVMPVTVSYSMTKHKAGTPFLPLTVRFGGTKVSRVKDTSCSLMATGTTIPTTMWRRKASSMSTGVSTPSPPSDMDSDDYCYYEAQYDQAHNSEQESCGGGGRSSATPYYSSDCQHGHSQTPERREPEITRIGYLRVVQQDGPEVPIARMGGMTLRSVTPQETERHHGSNGGYDVSSVASPPVPNSVASSPYPDSVASSPALNSVASSPALKSIASSPVANSVASSPGPIDDCFEEGDGFVEQEDAYEDECLDDYDDGR